MFESFLGGFSMMTSDKPDLMCIAVLSAKLVLALVLHLSTSRCVGMQYSSFLISAITFFDRFLGLGGAFSAYVFSSVFESESGSAEPGWNYLIVAI